MSATHPIISVTGSSGAGTTSVRRTFEHIFRREKITAAFIEGDAFHRYDRVEMKRVMAEEAERAIATSATSGRQANLLPELEEAFRQYGKNGTCRTRHYIHDAQESKALRRAARHVHGLGHGWQRHRPAVLRRAARLRGHATSVNLAQHADLRLGVVPVVNLEWIQKIHRDHDTRGYSTDAVVDTILRRMPDYVNYICPQFTADAHQLPARADGGYVESVHRAVDSDARGIDGGGALRESARHRLSLPAFDDLRQQHVARELARRAGRQARPRHAAHPDAAHLAASREERGVRSVRPSGTEGLHETAPRQAARTRPAQTACANRSPARDPA